jgi:hypothetical protein
MLTDSWTDAQNSAWDENDRLEVLYEGCKNFWRTRTNIDIIIVKHRNHRIIEIVTYAAVVDREATRLYLNDDILFKMIDSSEFVDVLRLAKEPFLRKRSFDLDKNKLMRDIIREAKVNYILNRVTIEECSEETRTFRVGFQFNFRDREECEGVDKLLVERPKHLKRFVSPHYKSLM